MSRSLSELAVEHGAPLSGADLPDVGVVIVNCDGRRLLADCLVSLDLSDYPREKVRTVVVDNGSRDGSAQWLARAWPGVEVVANERNLGFTPACNQGAARAAGASVLVFLNNDVRVEDGWLRALVSPIARGECASTGSKMLSIDGRHIDHAGGGANFHGIAIAHGYKDAPDASHDVPRRCLFACGGAMAIAREAFDALGGFDEDFFAYYDDLDIGWRTNLAGFAVHYAPAAVCHHHHSGTSRRFPREMIRLLEVRNPLLCCLKAYDDEHLDRLLPALLGLAVRRMYVFAREPDDAEFRIERDASRPGGPLRRAWRKLRGTGRTLLRDQRRARALGALDGAPRRGPGDAQGAGRGSVRALSEAALVHRGRARVRGAAGGVARARGTGRALRPVHGRRRRTVQVN